MAVVLQASLGAAPSPARDDSNVQQLKQRIKELEDETEELSRKYNEELKTERVRRWHVLTAVSPDLQQNLFLEILTRNARRKAREALERLRLAFTANGKRQIRFDVSSK